MQDSEKKLCSLTVGNRGPEINLMKDTDEQEEEN